MTISWKLRQNLILGGLFFVLGSLITTFTDDYLDTPNYKIIYKDTSMTKVEIVNDSLTKESVYNEILNQNIQFPKIVLAQARLESANFTSNVCKKYNNIFGFYNGKKYLSFPDVKSCIIYYKYWQDRHYKGGSYLKFLADFPYAQDSTYITLLKQFEL